MSTNRARVKRESALTSEYAMSTMFYEMTAVNIVAVTFTVLGYLWGRRQYARGVLAGRREILRLEAGR